MKVLKEIGWAIVRETRVGNKIYFDVDSKQYDIYKSEKKAMQLGEKVVKVIIEEDI